MSDPEFIDPLLPPAMVSPALLTPTQFSLLVGLILGGVAVFGGFLELLVVALFGLLGLLVGRILEGKLDLAALLGRSSGR